MDKSPWIMIKLLLLSFWVIIILSGHEDLVEARSYTRGMAYGPSPKALTLFVFGDSYVDTGNTGKNQSNSWTVPYGMTFPGRPTGRFSDGRVFTDFIARYLGLKTPVAYRFRTIVPPRFLRYGINFAVGGSGVFETLTMGPNMSKQIDLFQKVLADSYSLARIRSSTALVSLNGNDYTAYLAKNGSIEGFPTFISQVVRQLAVDVKRLHDLGIKRILVSNLAPLGCLPVVTRGSSYKQCEETINAFVDYHNQQLEKAVATLNRNTTGSITLLDLHKSFSSFLNPKGNSTFKDPLKPCCVGTSPGYFCGNKDSKTGEKKYSVCSNPARAVFWDDVHPTQAGWRSVFFKLINNLP